jgi:para-aminobenzoate synthetase component II
MILIIDNYDSFTYNLVQRLGELGATTKVIRNTQNIPKTKPSHIIISPGPCTPNEAGISNKVIKQFAGKVPILGVCLGHQCIAQVFGAKIVKNQPVHGKTAEIFHDKKTIYKNVKNPFTATRYHSLIVDKDSLPNCLEITAAHNNIIMGIRHKRYNIEGIQVHPESIMTTEGYKILKNFINATN